MGSVAYFMVLLGCGQGESTCQQVATLPVAYASQAVCLDARAEIVAASAGLGYDRVIAECRSGSGSATATAAKAQAVS